MKYALLLLVPSVGVGGLSGFNFRLLLFGGLRCFCDLLLLATTSFNMLRVAHAFGVGVSGLILFVSLCNSGRAILP